jgi:hypothetical protein
MPDQPSKDEPKLVVDEDWKEQVQREKEQAAATKPGDTEASAGQSQVADDTVDTGNATSTPSTDRDGDATESPTDKVTSPDQSDEALPPLPPASFDFLVTTLATQAMMALGQLPGPDGKQEKVQKPIAKHYIDLLGVLEEKTKGNLQPAEQRLLSEVLHNLRMTFVQVK